MRYFLIIFFFLSFACKSNKSNRGKVPQLIQLREPYDEAQIVLSPSVTINSEDAGYTIILPQDSVEGMIVLFHSGRDTSHVGFEQRLYVETIRRNIAAMYVTTGNPFEFLFEETAYKRLDRYIHKALSEHNIPANLLFAGMSLAGTRALKFGIWCQNGHSEFEIRPLGIAICDAPLDFNRFWRQGQFAINHQIHPTSVREAQWVNYQLEKHLGGTPLENLKAYYQYAPYFKSLKIDTRLACLKGVAIRAYTEPDVDWWMKNRNKDYYGMNAVDAAGLIAELNLLDHKNAQLITTTHRGYHPNGTQHPHSWSIVDNGELIEWFVDLIRVK